MVQWILTILLSSFFKRLLLFCVSGFFLCACASSNVEREAAASVDFGRNNAKNMFGGASSSGMMDFYQNANQTTKGALLGGAAGAVTGALASGIGVVPGTAVGAIFGGSYGAYIDVNTTVQDQLENRGVSVVVLGDQILLVVPSVGIFQGLTPHLKSQAYSTLNLIVRYINCYTKMLVKVAAYTDNTGSCRVDLALSQQQAESVGRFLVASGIDARLLYSIGYGGARLIAKNSSDWENSDNYRLEITLERLYV